MEIYFPYSITTFVEFAHTVYETIEPVPCMHLCYSNDVDIRTVTSLVTMNWDGFEVHTIAYVYRPLAEYLLWQDQASCPKDSP